MSSSFRPKEGGGQSQLFYQVFSLNTKKIYSLSDTASAGIYVSKLL